MDGRKRVRRGESFGRVGVDRTISNSLKSPSRQKQKQDINEKPLSVRFAEDTQNMIYLCTHYDTDMTPLQMDERKKELWYTRNDFEEFLRERISTIRLLKVVQGDAQILRQSCPDLCLRGLEPFQCDSLNHELQSQRQNHLHAVLTEQTLQKKNQKKVDPEIIRQLAQGRSEWARQRAQQLGSMDALEVKTHPTATLDDTAAMRRRSLASAQIGLENLILGQRPQPQRRASLSSLGGLTATPRRVPVDLAILKEWNAKFLQEIRQKNGGAAATCTNTAPKSLSDKTAESRRALQTGSLLFGGTMGAGLLSASSTTTTPNPASSLGYGELLKNSTTATTTSTAGSSFRFPVRRDSLVGLRRESFLANKQQQQQQPQKETTTPAPAPSSSSSSNTQYTAMNTLAAAAAAVSAGTAPVAEACFRFPVRRDSLSNVHWS